MICGNKWSYERYRQPTDLKKELYICRVAPLGRAICLDFIGDGSVEYHIFYKRMYSDAEAWNTKIVRSTSVVLSELEECVDYAFYVSSEFGKSEVGYAKTGYVPGTVVNYLHSEDHKYAFSGQFLCTPSLLKHPDGYLLASMDVFGHRTPQNLTLIFRSDDDGETWYHYAELFPCFWVKLFIHRGEVYMLSTSTEYGDLLIGKSSDGGRTWLEPTVLLRGSGNTSVSGWHKSAMPIIEHCGRFWTGIDYGCWVGGGHANSLLSVSVDSDLLKAENWHLTEPLVYDTSWNGSVLGDTRGFLEGNALVLPNGKIANILRYATDKGTPNYGLIPILEGNTEKPDQKLSFGKYVPFPGNLSKFDILLDEISGYYYSIVCRIHDSEHPVARNLLSLLRSPDLEHWEIVKDLIDYSHEDYKTTGFQYVSFLFDGDDILYLSRTAFNGAKSYHDNNYITFHRITDFRNITL